MKNKVVFITLFVLICPNLSSQIKVDNMGRVGIGTLSPEPWRQMTIDIDGTNFSGGVEIDATELGSWEPAIHTNVSNQATLSYRLSYNFMDRFYVAGAGWLWCYLGGYFGSDINMKTNITEIESPLEKVINLHGVSFEFKEDLGTTRTGVIAQEVEKVLPGAIRTMNDGSKAISYNDLIGLLIEAIKEQQNMIDNLKSGESNIKSGQVYSANSEESSDNMLSQNTPNPFDEDTQIEFRIAEEVQNSVLYIL